MTIGEEPVIVVRGLHKRYGEVEAVAGIDLTIAAGVVFALLGPNGAGKTTTVEILEGYRRRTEGDVRVLGVDPETGGRSLRERIGIVSQEGGADREFTVRETIELYSAAYPAPLAVDEVTKLVGLEEKGDARIRTLSGGQRRRLDFALGIAGNPELLFLDEPTTGFDPSARRRSWDLIRRLRSLGKTILLTTHYMEEAQRLADRVVVIAAGRVVADSTPARLSADGPALISYRLGGEQLTVETEDPQEELLRLLLWADDHDIRLGGLTVTQPSLEDVYLELTRAEER
jgi:ABC-2 type transport system ATP-binding protein